MFIRYKLCCTTVDKTLLPPRHHMHTQTHSLTEFKVGITVQNIKHYLRNEEEKFSVYFVVVFTSETLQKERRGKKRAKDISLPFCIVKIACCVRCAAYFGIAEPDWMRSLPNKTQAIKSASMWMAVPQFRSFASLINIYHLELCKIGEENFFNAVERWNRTKEKRNKSRAATE